MATKYRPTRRTTLAGLSALAGLSTLNLGGGRASAQTPKKGGTLIFIQNNEPQTLVALTTVATPALTVSAKVTEGLLEYDFDINPRPLLASDVDDQSRRPDLHLKLRPNVKFHDGKPFTSADVAYLDRAPEDACIRAAATPSPT